MQRHLARAAAAALLGTACCGAALAQSTSMMMPEGSKDLYIGVAAGDAASTEGGSKRQLFALPTASGLWSNGVFASLGSVGWDATDDPTMDYGPLLTYGIRAKRADGAGSAGRLDIEGGAFYAFMFAREISLSARLLYGGSADGDGLQLRLGTDVSTRLGPHDSLTISPGLTLADASFMRASYGISAQQAQVDGLPAYKAAAGLRDVSIDVDWNSELSTRYTLDSGVSLSRLAANAGRSPLIDQRGSVVLFVALSREF